MAGGGSSPPLRSRVLEEVAVLAVVRAYRNLHSRRGHGDLWSIVGPSGLVLGWAEAVEVRQGSFDFLPSRYRQFQARAQQGKRTKWLVVWLKGQLVTIQGFKPNPTNAKDGALIASLAGLEGVIPPGGRPVRYHPDPAVALEHAAFRTDRGEAVQSAPSVRLLPDACAYID